MAHTKYVTVLAQAIFDKIDTNKTTLGFDKVYFGDQLAIQEANVCVVNPGPKMTQLAGVAGPGGRVMRDLNVVIGVYSQIIIDTLDEEAGTEAEERLKLEQRAEAVEDLLHQDTTMGGIIIHGYVVQFVPGDEIYNNTMFRAVRLTFVGRTKLNLSI